MCWIVPSWTLNSTAAVPKKPRWSDSSQQLDDRRLEAGRSSSRWPPALRASSSSSEKHIAWPPRFQDFFSAILRISPSAASARRARACSASGRVQPVTHGHRRRRHRPVAHQDLIGLGVAQTVADRQRRRDRANLHHCRARRAAGARPPPPRATTCAATRGRPRSCRAASGRTSSPPGPRPPSSSVVGVAGVAGEHELGHDQPAGDRARARPGARPRSGRRRWPAAGNS